MKIVIIGNIKSNKETQSTKNTLMKKKSFFLRQIFIWIMTLVFFSSFIGKADAKNLMKYEKMTGEQKFTEIKEQVTNSALDVSKYKASEALKEIVKASNNFQKINSVVQKTDDIDRIIYQVADGLEKIALSYERVASFAPDISSHRKEEFDNLRDFDKESVKTEQELKDQIAEIEFNNQSIKRRLNSVVD